MQKIMAKTICDRPKILDQKFWACGEMFKTTWFNPSNHSVTSTKLLRRIKFIFYIPPPTLPFLQLDLPLQSRFHALVASHVGVSDTSKLSKIDENGS